MYETSAGVAVTVADIDGVYLEANDVFCGLVGRPRHEVVGRHFAEFAILSEDGKPDVRDDILAGDLGPFNFEATLLDERGEPVPVRVSVAVVRDEDDAALYTVTVLESIAEQRRLAARMKLSGADAGVAAYGALAHGVFDHERAVWGMELARGDSIAWDASDPEGPGAATALTFLNGRINSVAGLKYSSSVSTIPSSGCAPSLK